MRWSLFFLLILVFALLGFVGWVTYSQVRARRAGLPPPTWKSYIPFTSSSTTYRDSNFPSPRRGGIVGWVKDRFASLTNKRTSRGAYEEPATGGPGPYRGAGVDHDEAWDTRVGALEDGPYSQGSGPHGHYGPQESGTGPRREPYDSAGYDAGFTKSSKDAERGRNHNRGPSSLHVPLTLADTGRPLENPFDDNNVSTLRDISPRPVVESRTGK